MDIEQTPEQPMSIETVNISIDPEPIKEAVKKAVKEAAPKAVKLSRSHGKCPGCYGHARAIGEAHECVQCGTVFHSAVAPTLNGKTFDELFASAAKGETIVYTEPTRQGRTLEALQRHKVTSVFSNGGIVAAAARAGFTVLAHSPRVIIQKP